MAVSPFPDRDLYLFRQKALALSPTYDVFDEAEAPVLHIVRPIGYLRTFLAMGASWATLLYFVFLAYLAWGYFRPAVLLLVPVGLAASSLAGLLVSPYRHVYVYADASRERLLMAIIQERKLVILTAPYTLVDPEGLEIARFTKNYLYNVVRRRWLVMNPAGSLVARAWEDSIAKSLARRVVGPLYGLLRTNFILLSPDGGRLGEFNRQLTIFDRYVLDLRADAPRALDRRIAVALGILLDTGESR